MYPVRAIDACTGLGTGNTANIAPALGWSDWPPSGGADKRISGGGEMTQSHGTGADGTGAGAARIDWEGAERSPEFRELVHKRRSFVIPATAFYLTWFFGFIVLAGYAEDFMGREFITDGLTV